MKKRALSLLLALCMVFSMLPTSVFATVQTETLSENSNATAESSANIQNTKNHFIDVNDTDWFYDAVQYVWTNGIFNGISETEFNPAGTMTRGMFVTVLGRMAGVDTEQYLDTEVFTDVKPDMYHAPYVAWASKHGITSGVGDGLFAPDTLITRQQMATFFCALFQRI